MEIQVELHCYIFSHTYLLAIFFYLIIETITMKGRYKDMKKLLVLVLAGITVIMLAGCGEETKETKKVSGVEEIRIEEIHVENIQVEEIQVESILTEKVYLDDEYQSELEYNSKVNTWDNIPIQTF